MQKKIAVTARYIKLKVVRAYLLYFLEKEKKMNLRFILHETVLIYYS